MQLGRQQQDRRQEGGGPAASTDDCAGELRVPDDSEYSPQGQQVPQHMWALRQYWVLPQPSLCGALQVLCPSHVFMHQVPAVITVT